MNKKSCHFFGGLPGFNFTLGWLFLFFLPVFQEESLSPALSAL